MRKNLRHFQSKSQVLIGSNFQPQNFSTCNQHVAVLDKFLCVFNMIDNLERDDFTRQDITN